LPAALAYNILALRPMTPAESKVPSRAQRLKIFLRRAGEIVVASLVIAAILNLAAARAARKNEVAGFGAGVRDGALMPAALPALLLGRDVQIYAPKNAGRVYNLGYTVGVNGCGLIFFGCFFWRMKRMVYAARA
jgi:hypothetical protein